MKTLEFKCNSVESCGIIYAYRTPNEELFICKIFVVHKFSACKRHGDCIKVTLSTEKFEGALKINCIYQGATSCYGTDCLEWIDPADDWQKREEDHPDYKDMYEAMQIEILNLLAVTRASELMEGEYYPIWIKCEPLVE